jgi:hypothetical protein
MGVKWTVLLFVWLMLSGGMSLNWMAGGNFTQSDFDILRAKIDAYDRATPVASLAASAASLSDELGNLWAPAWNVAIVSFGDGQNYDAVLYGYAFNGHWFWQNGIQKSLSFYISFIIWKDYNCVRWITLDSNQLGYSKSTYSDSDTNAITSSIQGLIDGS